MLPPVTIIETLVAGTVPSSLVLRWSWEELSPPPAFMPLPYSPTEHRLLPSFLERGQSICQELKSFGACSRTFWYTKYWLEMW